MPYRNAPLTETGRLRLARCVIEEGWPVRRAAERFQVSPTTASRWARRYRDQGAVGMADRSSRPHASPNRTPVRLERRIVRLRVARRLGPARIAFRLGLNPSTVHAVLGPLSLPAAGPPGPGQRAADPPLRTGPARRAGPCRCQKARQHPRWRWLAHRGMGSGPEEQTGHHQRAQGQPPRHRLQLPA
jgi:transposase-like protein